MKHYNSNQILFIIYKNQLFIIAIYNFTVKHFYKETVQQYNEKTS